MTKVLVPYPPLLIKIGVKLVAVLIVSVLTAYAGIVETINGSASTTEKLNELVPTLPKLSVTVTLYVVVLSS